MNKEISYFKKALVMLMAVMMVFTMMPSMAWADDTTGTGENENVTVTATGNCGSDATITYTLYSDGKLVIEGSGTIKKGAWENKVKTKVVNLVIEDGITEIGMMAFQNYTSLQTIQSNGIKKIGSQAFIGCKKIRDISMTALENSANLPMPSCLENLTIGEKTTTSFTSNITALISLKKVEISGENQNLKVEEGMLMSKDGKKLYFCLRNGKTTVTVPDTVTSIEKYAFGNYKILSTVNLPQNLQNIGNGAFQGCTGLTQIQFPSKLMTIGQNAFKECTGLTQIELPGELTEITYNVFNNCTGLTQVNIPKDVETIQATAFSGCTNLEAFAMNGEGEKYQVKDGILLSVNDDKTKSIVAVPQKISGTFEVPDGITQIGSSIFSGCTGLQSISIPESVTSIGSNAFANCTNLESITLPQNITAISESMFAGCTALQTIAVPEKVTTIGKNAFQGCLSLESIALPASVTTIDEGAFNGSGITNLTIPSGVTSIPQKMCMECSNLETAILPKTITGIGENAFGGTGLKTIYFEGSYDAWNNMAQSVPESIPVICYYGAEEITGEFITTQPQDKTFTKDDTTAVSNPLTVTVTAPQEGETLEFNWYVNTKKTTKGGTKIAQDKITTSAGSSQCIADVSKEGNYYYYCLIVKTKGDVITTKWSDFAQVAVTYKDIFKGNGTEKNPYQIASQEDLAKLQEMVNNGSSMEGTYFKLTADITLPSGWVPMGCLKDPTKESVEKGENLNAFSGNIDGGNYTITVPENGKPLLGYVRNATVKNLKIKGIKIDGYGLVNNYTGINVDGFGINIENVTALAGTTITESGLLGSSKKEYMAGSSAVFTSTIKNCTIEKGVSIGSEATDAIGSIAGRFHGTIENCISYADVKGRNYVGGILGTRDNAMGDCIVKNCKFYGTVNGQKNVGGIVGSGYGYGGTSQGDNLSAPNAIRVTILSCTVGETATVTGTENVGGILGSDQFVAQAWDSYSIVANSFSGKINGQKNVGGIIGFYDSLNKMDNIAGNFFTKNCGAKEGIGAVKYIDTNYKNPTDIKGTTYFNTAKGITNCPTVEGCNWKANYNRTDDPLGADKEKLTNAVDTIPTEAFCYELVIDGTPKTEYYEGQELDFSNVTFTAKWTDGTETHPTFGTGEDQVHASGYNKNSHSVQTVILSYGYAQYELQVAVLKNPSTDPAKNTLTVKFTLLGDSQHDEPTDKGGPHGLATGGLTEWTNGTYKVNLNTTVWNLMQLVQQRNSNIKFNSRGSQYGTYVESVTYNGVTLAELDNGRDSGWMYTVNGKHPEITVGAYFLSDGDNVVFHYTDDYTKEEGSDKWNTPGAAVIEEIKDVTTDTKTGTTTAPTEVKVTEKVNADGTKTKVAEVKVSADNQKEILKQAKANKSKEIILSVATKAVGEATKADVTLDKSFIDSIVKDTDAKLTVKTPFGDKTYTQEELKAMSAAATGTTVTIAVEKAAEEPEVDVKALTAKLTPVARSAKTAKKNVKVTVSLGKQDKEILSQLKDAGYTVKYRFYRSTKKSAGFKSTVTKKTATYTNTSGKKGTKYFYKVQVRVYDENGKLVAKTALKQCKYATRTWTR